MGKQTKTKPNHFDHGWPEANIGCSCNGSSSGLCIITICGRGSTRLHKSMDCMEEVYAPASWSTSCSRSTSCWFRCCSWCTFDMQFMHVICAASASIVLRIFGGNGAGGSHLNTTPTHQNPFLLPIYRPPPSAMLFLGPCVCACVCVCALRFSGFPICIVDQAMGKPAMFALWFYSGAARQRVLPHSPGQKSCFCQNAFSYAT